MKIKSASVVNGLAKYVPIITMLSVGFWSPDHINWVFWMFAGLIIVIYSLSNIFIGIITIFVIANKDNLDCSEKYPFLSKNVKIEYEKIAKTIGEYFVFYEALAINLTLGTIFVYFGWETIGIIVYCMSLFDYITYSVRTYHYKKLWD